MPKFIWIIPITLAAYALFGISMIQRFLPSLKESDHRVYLRRNDSGFPLSSDEQETSLDNQDRMLPLIQAGSDEEKVILLYRLIDHASLGE